MYQARRTLATNLTSDGYFHVNEEALKSRMDTQIVKSTGRLNPRHLEICKDGWAKLEREGRGQMVEWLESLVLGAPPTPNVLTFACNHRLLRLSFHLNVVSRLL
jgi:hypothetical protein